MGTNYFALKDACGCCGKPDEQWHICKSFRTFQGYTHDGPLGHRVTEVQHWWPILRDPRITIRDEYGTQVDTEVFIQKCYSLGLRAHTWDEYQHGHYRDIEGFVLYNGDFF